jgi:PTS system fructose-specific IIC component
MITIADTLLPDRVLLDLAAKTPEATVEKLIAALRKDERIVDWAEFAKVVRAHPQCRVAENADFGIAVPHARTDAVSEMAMSAARLATPLEFPGCAKPIRYIFCFGIPMAMASDYLRIAGALMRIFSDAETEAELRAAATREAFVAALARLELKV